MKQTLLQQKVDELAAEYLSDIYPKTNSIDDPNAFKLDLKELVLKRNDFEEIYTALDLTHRDIVWFGYTHVIELLAGPVKKQVLKLLSQNTYGVRS